MLEVVRIDAKLMFLASTNVQKIFLEIAYRLRGL